MILSKNRRLAAFLLLGTLAAPHLAVGADDQSSVRIVNLEDPLPQPKLIGELIDTEGMSQRKFARAVRSWKGATYIGFITAWRGEFEVQPGAGAAESGELEFLLTDQDLHRVRQRVVVFPCDPMACMAPVTVPLVFRDDDTRRKRNCRVTLVTEGAVIKRVKLKNRGCRLNDAERDRLMYEPPEREPAETP